TMVADLPLAPGAEPAIAVGDDGLLYIALPRAAIGVGQATSALDGQLLRFTSEGAAAGRVGGSPILTSGIADPRVLVVGPAAYFVLGLDTFGGSLPVAVARRGYDDPRRGLMEATTAIDIQKQPRAFAGRIGADGWMRIWMAINAESTLHGLAVAPGRAAVE